MNFNLAPLLNLPNVVASDYSNTLGPVIIKIELINDGINCPNCNTYTGKVHQTRPVLIRDMAVFGQQVYLKVPRRQFYCPNCKTHIPHFGKVASKKPNTTVRSHHAER